MAITSRFLRRFWACSLTSAVLLTQIHMELKMSTRLAFVQRDSYSRFAGELVRVSNALLAAVVIAGATPAVGGESGAPATGTVAAEERTVGQFTGRFVNGAPVYRLPSIHVSASRTA